MGVCAARASSRHRCSARAGSDSLVAFSPMQVSMEVRMAATACATQQTVASPAQYSHVDHASLGGGSPCMAALAAATSAALPRSDVPSTLIQQWSSATCKPAVLFCDKDEAVL